MKAMMISFNPKLVASILNGEMNTDIRKSMPKCDLPIDVYIYCTKNKERLVDLRDDSFYCGMSKRLNGKVVAKFTLKKVDRFEWQSLRRDINEYYYDNGKPFNYKGTYKGTHLNYDTVFSHIKGGVGYAWHIDNLEIFDRPKEVEEFHLLVREEFSFTITRPLTKAPATWCYVWR